MSRKLEAARPLRRLAYPWLEAMLALTLAVGSGLLLAEVLMSPPAGDMRSLAAYVTLSAAVTTGGGWLLLRTADRFLGLSIQSKAFLSAVLASGVALLNVFIIAHLMFVSTSHDLKLLVALLASSAVVSAFFSLWVASSTTSRIERVAEGIRALARGDLAVRVRMQGGDEVAQLAADVNALASRLHAAEQQRQALDRERRELTAAISHDLRTPLASVRAMVEALDDQVVDDPAEISRYYGTMRREIERISRMIDDLFELAQMDAGALRLEKQPLALQDVAAQVVNAMRAQANRDGVSLQLAVDGASSEVVVDGTRIERVVANLVRNALEHSPRGGQVDVRVFAEDGWVGLRVSDTGDGIDVDDLPHIWDRFYRAEKSRRRGPKGADGAGLGLAIVRGIVEAHGGAVEVDSSPGQGASFAIRLPRQ